MNILKELGIDSLLETIESLKAQVIEVFETATTYFCPLTDLLKSDGFYLHTNANGNIHGKVSKSGSILAMTQLIDIAYDVSVENNLDLNFGEAELEYFKDESVCTLRIPLGISAFKTKNGFADATKVFLYIKTGFGGTACSEVGIYSHRFVCGNGIENRNGLNYFKAKHTEKMNELAKTFLFKSLPQMMNSVTDFTANAKKMDKVDITKEQIEEFRQSLFNYKTDDKISDKKQEMLDSFNAKLIEEQNRAGVTAWTLLQGATNYTNRRFDNNPNSQKNQDFIITGAGATFNAKAEKHCMALQVAEVN